MWEQLSASETLNRFTEKNPKEPFLEVIVHMAPKTIFLSDACRTWRESFGTDVRHIFLHTGTRMDKARVSNLDNGTPFHAAYAGALCRTKLSSLVYGDLTPTFPESMEDATTIEAVSYVEARPLLEYAVLPRIKAGFRNQNAFRENWRKIKSESDELLRVSGSLHLAKEILMDEAPVFANNGGELFFTGTGSAIPCKHRNVSGIYLKMENCNSMLLDVGEGTVGQLLRAKRGESGIIQGIKAVWISHPHADHHLGILRLLTERKYVADDPVVLIAPPNLLNFLKEYETIDPSIGDSYIFMDCRDITPKAQPSNWPKERLASHNSTMQRLRLDLGITSCTAISVAHCPHAYAVVLKGTSFGCLAYSGDCRPSEPFAAAAHDADLLIHEATFEDGMEAEALVKRHCTVGEALRVAKQMKAKTTVLTHFSQRYPRVPPLPTDNQDPDNGCPVIFAYDYMKLTPSNLVAASKITPALRLLYPETEKTVSAEQSAVAALGVPGLFAQKEIL